MDALEAEVLSTRWGQAKQLALRRNKATKGDIRNLIDHRESDRVPTYGTWIACETILRYGEKLCSLVETYCPDDIVTIDLYNTHIGYEPAPKDGKRKDLMVLLAQDSMWEDEWGVGRRHVTGGLGAAVVSHPIQEWCELDDYLQTRLPDVNEPGRFDAAQASVQEFGGKYLLGKMFACFFERMHFLRGMEQLLMDLYLNRREVIKLADRLLDFSLGMIRRWAQMGVDGVFLSDDWGTQDRLLVSPTLWRTVFGSYYRRMIEEAHHLGLQVFLHSCGNITEIVPDLVDMGLDVLHPIQPWAMDIERIAREFGRYITLFGGIDVQRLLTKSTPGEVKSEIRNLVEIVHKHHGTIILAPTNSIVPETPLENIEAMFQTYREIGIGGKGWF